MRYLERNSSSKNKRMGKTHISLLTGGLFWLAIAFFITSCTPRNSPKAASTDPGVDTPMPTETQAVELPDLGPATELTNDIWLNTEAPLRIADLTGNVILLDFWTFG